MSSLFSFANSKDLPRQLFESRPLRYGLFAIAIILPLLVHYAPFLFAGNIYISSDHQLFFKPFSEFIGNAYRHGKLPLWNPFLYLGMPQIALASPSYIYPPTLLYAVQSYSQAVSEQQILHHLVAAIGGALFCQSIGLGFGASAIAGLGFAFSGYMFSLSANYTLVAAVSWLPFALFTSRRIRFSDTKSSRCFWVALMSVAIFMMVSAGRPEVFVPVILIITAHAVTGFVRFNLLKIDESKFDGIDEHKPLSILFYRLLALVIGCGLAMPLLLPALEWASVSARANGMAPDVALLWSSNWYTFATIVLGQPFGDLQTLGNSLLPVAADRAAYMPFLPSAYVGAGVLTFALLGFYHTRSPWLVPACAVIFFGTIFTLGKYTPVLPWLLEHFSVLGVFRYPVKLIVLPIMGLCLLAGFGFEAVKNNKVGFSALRSLAIVWSVVLMVGLSLAVYGQYFIPLQAQKLSVNAEVAIGLGRALLHAGCLGILVVALCLFRQKSRISSLNFVLVMSILLGADLVGVSMRFPPLSIDRHALDAKPAVLAMLEKASSPAKISDIRMLNLYYDPIYAPSNLLASQPKERTLGYYRYCRDMLLSNGNIDFQFHSAYGYEGTVTSKYRQLVLRLINDYLSATEPDPKKFVDYRTLKVDDRLERYAAAASVEFVATQIARGEKPYPVLDKSKFVIVDEKPELNVRIYKTQNPTKRIQIVHDWKWIDSTEKAYKAVLEGAAGLDLVNCPLIETIKDRPNFEPIKSTSNDHDECQILLDQPEHITISVKVDRPSFLILRDQFFQGWRVQLNSVNVPVYRANGFTRAVLIPGGSHAVEFNYKPDGLKYGFRIALVCFAILLILFGYAFAPRCWRFVKWTAGQT